MHTDGLEVKAFRLLQLYTRFQEDKIVRKAEAAVEFGVTERSIQRDIEDLRSFFASQIPVREIIYDASVMRLSVTEKNTGIVNQQ